MLKPCLKCGNRTFHTTKTVNMDLNVEILEDGSMIDSECWSESDCQPDQQYFTFVCTACGENVDAD